MKASLALCLLICSYFYLYAESPSTSSTNNLYAGVEDVNIIILDLDSNISVEADGRATIVDTILKQVNREGGRRLSQFFRIDYTQDHSKIKVIDAYTVSAEGNKISAMGKIYDKEALTNVEGYDRNSLVTVTFPNVDLGAKTYIKYKTEILNPQIPNLFSMFMVGDSAYYKQLNFTIRSKVPLFLEYNNPDKVLHIEHSSDKKTITCRQLKPICYIPKAPSDDGSMEIQYLPYLRITTIPDMQKLGEAIGKGFEEEINKELPLLLQRIKEEAAPITNEVDQINFITNQISEHLNYIQQYTTYKGHFRPRPLEDVCTAKAGDCKEMAAILCAILRKIGYQAFVVLVKAGSAPPSKPHKFCILSDFNHAVVKAISKTGKIYWVDPTMKISMAGFIPLHLSSKHVLVLNGQDSKIETIPAITPQENESSIFQEIHTAPHNQFKISGVESLKGLQALYLTGATKFASKDQVEQNILLELGHNPSADGGKVELPNLDSLILKDVEYKFSLTGHELRHIRTQQGTVYAIPPFDIVDICRNIRHDRLTALYIGKPFLSIVRRKFIGGARNKLNKSWLESFMELFKSTPMSQENNMNILITSPWMSIDRSYKNVGDGDLEVTETRRILKEWITREEIHSDEFKKFQDEIREKLPRDGVLLPN